MGEDKLPSIYQEKKLEHINKTFKIAETINHLHGMMKSVTEKEMSPKTVHAACACVSQLNETIDMTIKAARFLNEK